MHASWPCSSSNLTRDGPDSRRSPSGANGRGALRAPPPPIALAPTGDVTGRVCAGTASQRMKKLPHKYSCSICTCKAASATAAADASHPSSQANLT
ncbi:unnamed protein product [Urochloa humidicola]